MNFKVLEYINGIERRKMIVNQEELRLLLQNYGSKYIKSFSPIRLNKYIENYKLEITKVKP